MQKKNASVVQNKNINHENIHIVHHLSLKCAKYGRTSIYYLDMKSLAVNFSQIRKLTCCKNCFLEAFETETYSP